MSAEIATKKSEIKGYRESLDSAVDALKDDPSNADLIELRDSLRSLIEAEELALEALQAEQPAKSPETPPKWSKDKHPAFQGGQRGHGAQAGTDDQPAVSYKANDTVMAQWVSGDKGFYEARITSVTGSNADPVYIVSFTGYNETDTVRRQHIRPLVKQQKRKADEMQHGSGEGKNGGATSATAAVDSDASKKKKEPSKATTGPDRPDKAYRQVKSNKALEANKSKWQEFAKQGGKVGKVMKKPSMFRTGESLNARVGFTGSGQTMRKDQVRKRHVHQEEEEDE